MNCFSRSEVNRLFAPLIEKPKACGYTVLAIVLVLLHLTVGSRRFISSRIASCNLEIPYDLAGALYQFSTAFFLFFLVPVGIVTMFGKRNLRELGLGLGDWRLGFIVFMPIGLLAISVPGALGACSMPAFWDEYPLAKSVLDSYGMFILYEMAYGLLFYTAYESFFRGILQFQLRESLGPTSAILIQTSITTLLHIGKPEAEIASALFAGLIFGSLAFHVRSVWPLVIIHWALGTSTDICCAIASGRW